MPQSATQSVDFSTYILSLASSTMVALGKIKGPDGAVGAVDLETARSLIDILEMLQAKTKGNLDATEGKLLATLLYDSRMAYVDVQKAQGSK